MQIFITLTAAQIQRLQAILEKPDNELSVQDARNLKRMIKANLHKTKR